MAAAVDNLTPVILELGGKDPMIVFDDVSLEWALAVVMRFVAGDVVERGCERLCV